MLNTYNNITIDTYGTLSILVLIVMSCNSFEESDGPYPLVSPATTTAYHGFYLCYTPTGGILSAPTRGHQDLWRNLDSKIGIPAVLYIYTFYAINMANI